MLIGVISDIHGNSVALKNVLGEAKKLHIEHLLVLGDLVGYYYDAKDVYELLADWSKDIVRGNHENMLLDVLDGKVDVDTVRSKYGSGLSIAIESLPTSTIADIRDYDVTKTLTFDGFDILIGHGTPWDTNAYVYPDADRALVNRCDQPNKDFVFLGHTHYPVVFKGMHSLTINPGSVGQSRVHGGVADWGVLNTTNGAYVSKHTHYSVEALKKAVQKRDPDVPYLSSILDRNRT